MSYILPQSVKKWKVIDCKFTQSKSRRWLFFVDRETLNARNSAIGFLEDSGMSFMGSCEEGVSGTVVDVFTKLIEGPGYQIRFYGTYFQANGKTWVAMDFRDRQVMIMNMMEILRRVEDVL